MKQIQNGEQVVEENNQNREQLIDFAYEEIIEKYKNEINQDCKNLQSKRNLLAFAYLKAGRIDEARNELMSLIEQYSNYTSYRLLVHLEKCEGNLDDARLWAYECLDRFPDSIHIREKLISIDKKENSDYEEIR